MSLDLIREVWDAMCLHIDNNEQKDAADTLISFLIDNNYEVEDIKDSFVGDRKVLTALKDYLSEHDNSDFDSYDEEDEYEDEEW